MSGKIEQIVSGEFLTCVTYGTMSTRWMDDCTSDPDQYNQTHLRIAISIQMPAGSLSSVSAGLTLWDDQTGVYPCCGN